MSINPQQARVLVVEDNADNLFIATDLLQAVLKVRYCNARAAGFDGFIGKPISSCRFPQQIQRILAGDLVWEPR